jgi:hypothetical protein
MRLLETERKLDKALARSGRIGERFAKITANYDAI